MDKKALKTVGIILGCLLAAYLLFVTIVPRVLIYIAVKNFMPELDTVAENFTDYSASQNGMITVSVNDYYIDIPSGYEEKVKGETTFFQYNTAADYDFAASDIPAFVVAMENSDLSGLNFLDPKNVSDNSKNIGMEQLKKGFEGLGHGLPDSGYNALKCMALLERDDYSFWDLKKATAFSVIGIIKGAYCGGKEHVYIYEKDGICGIVTVERKTYTDTGAKGYSVVFEFFRPDDLNTDHTVMFGVNSPEKAYPIINSIKFAE